MKKIISAIVALVMLVSTFSMGVNAAGSTEISEAKDKLIYLVDSISAHFMWGNPHAYYHNLNKNGAYDYAQTLYNSTEEVTDEEYTRALNALVDNCVNMTAFPKVLKDTYENAAKEQNYNNFYSESDWAEFQSKLRDFKTALEDETALEIGNEAATKAYHDLLSVYNRMTNAYKVVGDIDKDGCVDVSDVTLLQKYLVGMVQLTGAQKMLTGSSNYDSLTIQQVTNIQSFIASGKKEMSSDRVFLTDMAEYNNFKTEKARKLYEQTHPNFCIVPRMTQESGAPPINNETNCFEYLTYYYEYCNSKGYDY